ncbi:MAG: extracellular solute-binding protein [Spirochaetaceae bacterium]|nr:MAG: extracellular solute-binding protein [Spirochaetaceae bacterium]
MKRTGMLVLLLTLVALFAFAGGGRETGTDAQRTLTINSYMSDEAPRQAFAALVADFEARNPDIRVVVNTTAHEQFKTLLPTWLTSRQAPDVVTWFAGYRMQAFADQGLLEPLTAAFPGTSFQDAFPEAFVRASTHNNTIYFVPQSWYWWAVYYNRQVFDRLGLQTPNTWDEFLQVSAALRNAGIEPIAIGARDTWTAGGWFGALNAAMNGIEFHLDLTSGRVPYTDPQMRRVFETFADLNTRGYIMRNATSYSWQEAATLLFNGQAGMYLMGQFIKDVAPENVRDNIDFFRFPSFGRPGYAVETPIDGFMVPRNAQNKEDAMRFMAYLATRESQELFTVPLGRLAANKHVPAPNPDARRGLDMVLGAEGATQFYDRDAPEEMAARGQNALIEAMQNPARIPQILTELDQDRQRIHR